LLLNSTTHRVGCRTGCPGKTPTSNSIQRPTASFRKPREAALKRCCRSSAKELSQRKPGLRLFSNNRPAPEAVVALLLVVPHPQAVDEAAEVRAAVAALVEVRLQRLADVDNRPQQ